MMMMMMMILSEEYHSYERFEFLPLSKIPSLGISVKTETVSLKAFQSFELKIIILETGSNK